MKKLKVFFISLLLVTFYSNAWDLVNQDPFTIRVNDTFHVLPIFFVCNYDGSLKVYQDDEDVSDKVISSDSGKIINNLYGIFYGEHSSIEVNNYLYVVHSVDEVEMYMRHCND